MAGGERVVWLSLTDGQVREVLRSSTGRPELEGMLSGLGEFEQLQRIVAPLLEDRRYSSPTLRSLLVLAALPADGSKRSVKEVAQDVGLVHSNAHRILSAFTAVGLLSQDPRSRAYARPNSHPEPTRR